MSLCTPDGKIVLLSASSLKIITEVMKILAFVELIERMIEMKQRLTVSVRDANCPSLIALKV